MNIDELKKQAAKSGLVVGRKPGRKTLDGTTEEKVPKFSRLYKEDVDYSEKNGFFGHKSLSDLVRTIFRATIKAHRKDNEI